MWTPPNARSPVSPGRAPPASGRGWATILVFHTLSETYPHDGITMSPQLFRDIAVMLRADYDVIPLTDLVARLTAGRGLTGREVVITFDDGYLDNYQLAAPVLSDLGLPACFYLTAGFIESNRQFPWDTEKGRRTVMMSWKQARPSSMPWSPRTRAYPLVA